MARKLTAVDVYDVTGYSRSELRSLLDALPHYRREHAQPRKARQFTRQDLILICLVQVLEAEYGMRKDAIALVFDGIRSALSGPKDQNREACLVISVSPPTVKYEETPVLVSRGTCVPLGPVFERVDRHVGSFLGTFPEQRDLLNPTVIGSRARPKAS